VTVSCEGAVLGRFSALLQDGVTVPALTGTSVAAFLTGELGVPPEQVAARISTVFLDGAVVDSLEGATLREGSVLALSAAMPGLVGATLRRGGFYASMRAGITCSDDAPAQAPTAGTIRLKLFNLLIAELGPAVLAHGILIDAATARAALPPAAAGALPSPGAGSERVLLQVFPSPEVPPCA
jgi:hypothetical protein